MASRTVRVHLHFPPGGNLPSHALLRLRVENVSAADKAAPVIAEKTVELAPGADITIAVPAERIDAASSYSVFLHLDANRSGQIEPGDFISPALHPVLTHGAPDDVQAYLIKIA